jgi:mannose/cellobiose epimerase-like protein (N-acyl-D-glucosamine 2-epimerase family)
MSEANRYDVIYGPAANECRVESHFCREWDTEGGCYGTNPGHGFTWEEARAMVAEFYKRLSDEWATKDESSL